MSAHPKTLLRLILTFQLSTDHLNEQILFLDSLSDLPHY